jgi:TolA-binding protein
LREFAKLDRKHDGWEETINTPQFEEWTFSNGPTPTERAQWKLMKAGSPEQAEQFFQSFAQRYPQWWTEKGSLMASDQAKDAIALLDGYVQHNQTVSTKQKQQAKNTQRLEAAITPQGAGAPPSGQPTQDEEAAFRSGYKKQAGR